MEIKRIRLGFTNCYLLEGSEGYVIVDTGIIRQQKKFISGLHYHGIEPGQIRLIIITHGHFDHVGSLAAIKTLCNDCPVFIHPLEARRISIPEVAIPPGTNLLGKVISSLGMISRPILKFPPVTPEKFYTEEMDLIDYGIEGKVIHTPGHTSGSLSILLAGGHAIVGDLAVNFTREQPFPPFAENPPDIYKNWQSLIAAGARTIYPAHGPAFPVEWLEKKLPE